MKETRTEEDQIIEHVVPATQPFALPVTDEAPPPGEFQEAPPEALSDEEIEEPIGELPAELESVVAEEPATVEDTAEALVPLGEYRLRSVLESLLLVADRPLPVTRIVEILEEAASPAAKQETRPPLYQAAEVQTMLLALSTEYRTAGRGIELHQVAGAWQLRTAADNAVWVQRFLQQKPMRLARAQLEVLAIVAYRQPITRPEIDDIRGVDSGGALKMLLERRLLRILGKKEEPGRPLLYGTTKEFLEFFNLRDLKELPTLREYYDLSEEHKAKVRAEHGEVAPELPLPVSPAPEPMPPQQQPDRVEITAQHLIDDAEQLGKIDELISSVSTDFSALDAVLSPPPPPVVAAPPVAPAAAAEPAPEVGSEQDSIANENKDS